MNLLSGDPPRGRALQILIVLIVLALALAPFLFPGAKALNTAAKTCVMILLVASYDVLLGYAGIVSFAHVMFFGVGAYGVGLALYGLGPSWGALVAGLAVAFALSLALALAIGLFSLRVQAIFFAMVTLAVAYAFNVLASQLSWLTGGEDGRSFKVPAVLQPGFKWLDHPIFGVQANGKLLAYYLVFVVVARRLPRASADRQLAVRAGACRRSARTRSAPRRWATAPSSTGRSRPASRRSARRSPAP